MSDVWPPRRLCSVAFVVEEYAAGRLSLVSGDLQQFWALVRSNRNAPHTPGCHATWLPCLERVSLVIGGQRWEFATTAGLSVMGGARE